MTKFGKNYRGKVMKNIKDIVDYQLWKQVSEQIDIQVADKIQVQVSNQSDKVHDQVSLQVQLYIENLVRDQL
jgi:hypothetical protein